MSIKGVTSDLGAPESLFPKEAMYMHIYYELDGLTQGLLVASSRCLTVPLWSQTHRIPGLSSATFHVPFNM